MTSNMIDQSSNPDNEYDLLCQVLPETLVNAAEVCSLPHSISNELGYKILHDFAHLNGTARAIWAEVRNLPFVYPYEEEGWRFYDAARSYFICRLEKRNGTFTNLNQYLKSYYESELQHVKIKTAPRARELEWRIIYHLAPITPEAAIERLRIFGEHAAQSNRIADMKGVVDLFEEQECWLSSYKVERTYFEGRYAYAKNNYQVAEKKFRLVWEQGKADEMKAIAGHLLGRILESRSAKQWLIEAESLYRESLKILKDIGDRRGVAMVLNSLGGVLVKVGGQARLEEAESLYRESLKIGRELGLVRHIAMVLNSLGGVLVKVGGQARLEEAESLYRESLVILKDIGDRRGVAMVSFRFSVICEDVGDYQKACEYLEKTIEIEKTLGNQRFLKRNIQRLEKLRNLCKK